MRWINDGSEAIAPIFPEGVGLVTYADLPNAMTEWLDIVRFMGQEEAPARDEAYYKEAMNYKWYSEDKCFFLTVDGKANFELRRGDCVRVVRAERTTKLIRVKERSFDMARRQKLSGGN